MAETQEARWYVVHTYSGYENKVATDLATMVESRGMQDLIQDIKIPTEIVTEIKDDKKREIERKIFPGYVLIKMIVSYNTPAVVSNNHFNKNITGKDFAFYLAFFIVLNFGNNFSRDFDIVNQILHTAAFNHCCQVSCYFVFVS